MVNHFGKSVTNIRQMRLVGQTQRCLTCLIRLASDGGASNTFLGTGVALTFLRDTHTHTISGGGQQKLIELCSDPVSLEEDATWSDS